MVIGSNYNRGHLKERIIKDNLIKNECNICQQQPIWKDKKLVLVLDHINGIPNDNRLENLRLLCPNCNSQQNTFAGRNKIKTPRRKYFCKCGLEKVKGAKKCPKCSGIAHRVIEWPKKETLREEIKTNSFLSLAKKYNVSDNAIRKWCKVYDILDDRLIQHSK